MKSHECFYEYPNMEKLFADIEGLEVDNELRLFYKSFFVFIRTPEIVLRSFLHLLKADPG